MARRKHYRRHHRHHRSIGAVRASRKTTIMDLALIAAGAIGGGFVQSKLFTSLDPKIKGLGAIVIGGLGMSSKSRSLTAFSSGFAASGAYSIARSFNIIGALPAPVGLLPEPNYQSTQQHVTAVGNSKQNDLMVVGALDLYEN